MALQATWFDLVIGLCIHWEMLPPPVSSPCPFPHPYIGLVTDFMGEAMGAAIGALTGGGSPAPVHVNGVPVATTGMSGTHVPGVLHVIPIPPGVSWCAPTVPLPSGDADLIMGSKTVRMRGAQAVRMGDITLTDHDPIPLPTGAVIAIPKGRPVLTGGPPAVDAAAVAFAMGGAIVGEIAGAAGGAALRGIRSWQKSSRVWARVARGAHAAGDAVADSMSARFARLSGDRVRDRLHRAACVLTGHPVDVATGKLVTWDTDLELPGPIPLTFERQYSSSLSYRDGVLGHGWSHSLDQSVWLELDQLVYKAEDGREIELPTTGLSDAVIRPGQELVDPHNRLTLRCTAPLHFEVELADNRILDFAPVPGDASPTRSMLRRIRTRNGHVVDLRYDRRALLDLVVDSCGRRIVFEHDEHGRLTRLLVPDTGTRSKVTPPRPPQGGKQLVPDSRTASGYREWRRYEYSDRGDLVAVYDPANRAFRYEYEAHLLVREVNRTGFSYSFAYDGSTQDAWCTRTWGDGGVYDHKIVYDKANRWAYVTNSLGASRKYFFDERLLVTKIADSLGGEERFAYDEHARRTEHTDLAGRTTRFTWNERGDVVRTVAPGGATTEIVWDERHHAVEVTDPRGGVWRSRFDAQDQLVERTNACDEVTRFEWEHGLLRAVVMPGGARSEHGYEGKMLHVARAPNGRERRVFHDVLGRVVRVRNPREKQKPIDGRLPGDAVLVYHAKTGELVQETGFDGVVRHYDFDADGKLVREHSLHHDIRYEYAPAGFLAARETVVGADRFGDPEPRARVELLHDTEGRLVGVRNELGELYRFLLDPRGEVVGEVGFDGGVRRYVRNSRTNELEQIWLPSCRDTTPSGITGRPEPRWDPKGRKSVYDFDDAGRVSRVVHSDGTALRYAYDLAGAIVSIENESAIVRFERDLCGRVVREETVAHDDPETPCWARSTFDLAGDRQRVETSLGLDLFIRRDAIGDVASVEVGRALALDLGLTPLPPSARPKPPPNTPFAHARSVRPGDVVWRATFERDQDGLEVARRLPGGVAAHWERDPLLGLPDQRRIDAPNAVLQETTFDWDDQLGVLLGVTDTAHGAIRYGYDARLRLTNDRDPNRPDVWHFRRPDAAGNLFKTRDRTDRVYGPGGVLLEAETIGAINPKEPHAPSPRTRYVHDKDGNLIEKIEPALSPAEGPDGGTWKYAWNGHGLLTKVERPNGAIVTFAYDALARRIRKTVTTRETERTTRWLWDGDTPVHEWTTRRASGADVAGSAPLLASPPTTWIFEPETFTPLAKLEGDRRFAVIPDQVGAPNVLVDEAGKIAWRAQLDLFGVPQIDVDETACPWRWPGQYEDEETGLYYNNFRYYDSLTGAFISSDPLRLSAGLRAFGYAHNPLAWIDPLGLTSCDADELTELTAAQIHEWMGRERHHSVFRMLLRAFRNSGQVPGATTAAGHLRAQRLVPLPTSSHRQLHEIWDTRYPELARGEGASQRVGDLIRSGDERYAPSSIMDRLEQTTRTVLADEEGLPDALANIASMRSRLGI
ncbi:MAG: hypothetical protein IT379_37955 [Deltaproteobacteria bacterium]|nr:hypothetical protein [Deltaproteobacteria bacterium]